LGLTPSNHKRVRHSFFHQSKTGRREFGWLKMGTHIIRAFQGGWGDNGLQRSTVQLTKPKIAVSFFKGVERGDELENWTTPGSYKTNTRRLPQIVGDGGTFVSGTKVAGPSFLATILREAIESVVNPTLSTEEETNPLVKKSDRKNRPIEAPKKRRFLTAQG